MLPRDRAEKIITLSQAGWSVRDIARQLGHAPQTIRDYLSGDRTPGVGAPRPSLLTDPLVNYCRRRFVEDPHLRPASLFKELTGLPLVPWTHRLKGRTGRWQSHAGSSTRTSRRARCGWSGRPASRSRRWPGTWGSTRGPWGTG